MENRELVAEAFRAKERAYVPYSGFMVGAALLTKNGVVYRGCNIESAAYSPTNCAERTAFFKAVSEGEREFVAIAVTGSHRDTQLHERGWAYPCGVCRQVMMEFCDPESFRIVVARTPEEYAQYTLKQLLPNGFGPANLT